MAFSVDINKFVAKCKTRPNLVIKKMILDVGKSLVEKTPVGDAVYWKSKPPVGYVGGHARANWSYSTGVVYNVVFPDIDKTGDTSIKRIQGAIPNDAAGKVHFISNSVPYIQALEDGHSKRQAPFGMVALTEMQFQKFITMALIGLK